MKLKSLFAFGIVLIQAHTALHAQPLMVNYQGRLSQISGAVFPNGPADVRVRLFDAATGGNQVWDSGIQTVQTRDGVFSVLLQGGTPTLTSAQFIPGLRYFQISVRQGATWTDLTPRQIVTSVPWAFIAGTVPDGAITNPKLAANAVATSNLLDLAITNAKLGNGSVTTEKLVDGSVTSAKLGANSVDSSKIVDNSVATGDLAHGAVTTSKLADGSVTTPQIAADSVVSTRLALDSSSLAKVTGGLRVATSDPEQRVQSYGRVRMLPLDGLSSGMWFSTSTTNRFFLGLQSPAASSIGLYSPSINSFFLSAHTDGRVAIGGALNASERLHIVGDTRLDGALNFNGGSYTLSNSGTGVLSFMNAGGTRVTFTNGGRVGIGTTSPDSMFHVTGQIRTDHDTPIKPTGGSWTPISSDRRLKKNIGVIPKPLETLLRLHGVRFEYRDPQREGVEDGKHLGFIAQDVGEVFPDWLVQRPDGYYTYSLPSGFSALTVEAIREQQNQIEQLKRELAREKAARASLERRMAEIERALRTRR